MGRRDIAELLLGRGARLDLFAAAMLGELEIVRAMLDAFPELVSAKGPHGIPLRVHAEKGGEEAQAVLALLDERSVSPEKASIRVFTRGEPATSATPCSRPGMISSRLSVAAVAACISRASSEKS